MAKCLSSQDDLPLVLFLSEYEAKNLISLIIRFPYREFVGDVDERPVDDILQELHRVVVKGVREPIARSWPMEPQVPDDLGGAPI